uniref:Uncharacterized protein n=1 Tax=Solanum demissum TaxID=50514 RepID=Q6L3R1_SOLDE|nr:hypothetical protein SDM1_41t00020 [Solanum demissum]
MEMDSWRTTERIGDIDPDRLNSQNPKVKEQRETIDGMEPLAQVGDARLTSPNDLEDQNLGKYKLDFKNSSVEPSHFRE